MRRPRYDVNCIASKDSIKPRLRRRNRSTSMASAFDVTTRRMPIKVSIRKLPISALLSRVCFTCPVNRR